VATFDPVAFQGAFPEFATTSAAAINIWASLVQNSPQGDWFTNTATSTDQMLIVAHVGHLLTQAATGTGGPGGALVSAGEGGVNASFAAPPVTTALEYYLSGSTYGQMLLVNLRAATAGGFYIGGLPERQAYRKVGGVFN
jgi:hypothetical protein